MERGVGGEKAPISINRNTNSGQVWQPIHPLTSPIFLKKGKHHRLQKHFRRSDKPKAGMFRGPRAAHPPSTSPGRRLV